MYISASRLAILLPAFVLLPFKSYAVDYQYDALGRLLLATYSNGQTASYSYDPAGNILSIESAGSSLHSGLTDLTSNLDIVIGGLRYSRRSRTYRGLIEIRNTSATPLTGPFTLQLVQLSPTATLVNSTGENDRGPWLNTDSLTLAAGHTTSILVEFTNTGRQIIDYQIQVFGTTN